MAVSPLFARLHPPGSGGVAGPAGADGAPGAAGAAGAAGASGASPAGFHHIGATADRYYIAGMATAGTLGAFTSSGNTLFAVPFVCGRSGTVDSMRIRCNSGVAGNLRVGIYANTSNSNLAPAALLFDSGTVLVASGDMTFAVSPAVALVAGNLYWPVLLTTTNPAFQGISAAESQPFFGISAFTGNPGNNWTKAFTFAALPDPFPSSPVIAATAIPAIGVRFAT